MSTILSNLGEPTMRHMLSKGMANRLQGFIRAPFARATEVSSRQIRGSVDAVISHIYKSLASTAGGNFEAFSAVARNPYLPIDLNGSGIMLGKGVDPGVPISKTNPPDEETQAFMLEGGHFYTVNMYVPDKIKQEWNGRGKGDDAQGDYYIVVPPTTPDGTYEIHILEFKAGMSHLEMDIKEEEQMLKEKQVIETWYRAIGKSVKVSLYYCPYLAGDAPVYRDSHKSSHVNYITLSALSKILSISQDNLLHFAQVRSKFNEEFTKKAYAVRDLALAKIKAEQPLSLNQIKALSSKSNFNVNFGPNISSTGNYQTRRARISQLLTRRKIILDKLENANAKTGQNLQKNLVSVTATILKLNRYPSPSNKSPMLPVLANNSYTKMLNWLRTANLSNVKLQEETAFRTILEERKYVVGKYTFPKLLPSEYIPPISRSERTLLNVLKKAENQTLTAKELETLHANFKTINRGKLGSNNQAKLNALTPTILARYRSRHKTGVPESSKRKKQVNNNNNPINYGNYFFGIPTKKPALNKNAYLTSIANRSDFAKAYSEFLTKNIPAGNLRQKLINLGAQTQNTYNKEAYNIKRRYVNSRIARAQ
jgi:hypothetical protein